MCQNRYTYILAIYILFVSACVASKSPIQNSDDLTERVLLDSLVITPETNSEPAISLNTHVSTPRTMDLLHTGLDLSIDWKNQTIHGVADLSLTPFAYPADTLTLNAQYFDIHQVSVNNQVYSGYTYDGSLLHIPLAEMFEPGQAINCAITYTAHPHNAPSRHKQGMFFIDAFDTLPDVPQQIWTIGETQYNSQWFPTIDFPNEKHTQDIFITVDTQFVTLSNGALVSSELKGTGMRTDHWTMTQPHAPYLTLMVVGKYDIVRDKWNSIPVNYYVDPGYGASARDIFAHTPEMLSFFSELLDYPYPWPKFDQVVVHDFTAGAMENTTAVTFASYIQKYRREFLVSGENDGIVAHEMFHQWFGDLLTCESWSHLALNEGFANYGEHLWNEHHYGVDEAQRTHLHELQGYLHAAAYSMHSLIYFNYEDPDQMFDAHSYNKGSLVLHQLRAVLGDVVFFQGLRKYLRDYAFQSVEAHDLRLAMEAVSGLDLNLFFDQWYFSAGHPVVSSSESYLPESGELQITLSQVQDPLKARAVFEFPLTIQLLYHDRKGEIVHLLVHERDQLLTIPVSSMPEVVVYDPEGDLLWDHIQVERTSAQCQLMINHQNSWLVRNEAVLYLIDHLNEFSSDDIRYVLHDPHWELRQNVLYEINLNEIPELKSDVVDIATQDPDARVRLAAGFCLGETADTQFAPIFVNLINSSKVHEISTGLEQLTKCDLRQALDYAMPLEQDSSTAILLSVSIVYAMHSDLIHRDFFRSAALRFSFQGKSFFENYARWISGLGEASIKEEVISLRSLALSPKPDIYTRFYATYCLWTLISFLPENSSHREYIATTISGIRQLTEDPALNKWYQSFD